MTRRLTTLAVTLCAVSLAAVCAEGCVTGNGELMLVITTDMPQTQLDQITISVTRENDVAFGSQPVSLKDLPATLDLAGAVDDSRPLSIKVVGTLQSVPRVERDIIATIPGSRQAILRAPLNFLCLGSGGPNLCPKGKTCVAGDCVSATVDSSALPAFSAADVFGGGTSSSSGTCLNPTTCFAGATSLSPDSKCQVSVPTTPQLNIALATKVNGATVHEILEVGSPEGYQVVSDGIVQLPPAVCIQLAQGVIDEVDSSSACAQKTAAIPICH